MVSSPITDLYLLNLNQNVTVAILGHLSSTRLISDKLSRHVRSGPVLSELCTADGFRAAEFICLSDLTVFVHVHIDTFGTRCFILKTDPMLCDFLSGSIRSEQINGAAGWRLSETDLS